MESKKIKSHRDLKMWQKSKDFALAVYKVTERFPQEERYGLTSQLRRASVSVVSNIAEGFRRRFPKEKVQFLRMAYGSCAEIDTQLVLSFELGYCSKEVYGTLISDLEEIEKIIHTVINKL